jgi:CDGSH-type Zn-finger protein/ferredoxin
MSTIDCRPNGPYLVEGGFDLRNSRDEALKTEVKTFLCRCGGSAKKPYCDGTHRKNGFSDARIGGLPDKVDIYEGRSITLHDNRSICAHAGLCTDRLASVFKYGSEPWIDPDGAPVEAIVDAVRRCPSGALSYSIDGRDEDAAPAQARINVTRDGPYAVSGIGLSGVQRERYTLCRCGASKNKPFCDGSHWDAKFTDG